VRESGIELSHRSRKFRGAHRVKQIAMCPRRGVRKAPQVGAPLIRADSSPSSIRSILCDTGAGERQGGTNDEKSATICQRRIHTSLQTGGHAEGALEKEENCRANRVFQVLSRSYR
jgi:hypothetical protein